jgi:16S rRNA (guanine(1405)-N(7))-methyltransferase
MQESSNKNAEIMNEVIDKLVGEILKSYKVDNDFLREFILKHIQGNRELISIIEKDNDFKKIARTRVYKDFAIT